MIGSHTDPSHYRFSREQSRSMAHRDWEVRLRPVAGYAVEIARLLGIAAAGVLLLVALLAVTP